MTLVEERGARKLTDAQSGGLLFLLLPLLGCHGASGGTLPLLQCRLSRTGRGHLAALRPGFIPM